MLRNCKYSSIASMFNSKGILQKKPIHSLFESMEDQNGSNPFIQNTYSKQKQTTISKNSKEKKSLLANSIPNYQNQFSNVQKCDNIKVYARFRPNNDRQLQLLNYDQYNNCIQFQDYRTVIIKPENIIYTLDKVFNISSTQIQVFQQAAKQTIQDVLYGYNGTIIAYGQTGSGKTHTMYGNIYDKDKKGIIPRSMQNILSSQKIFNHIRQKQSSIQFKMKCSMLEIYKENLLDMLSDQKDLKIKQSPSRGIYIEGLTQNNVHSQKQLQFFLMRIQILDFGEQNRKIASTRLNQVSSRSHTLFIVQIIQTFSNDTKKIGKLYLVDLAGSQKVNKTGSSGSTLEQAKKINLSLSCLGNVIHNLTKGNQYVPYRDSKLTRILSQSIGGNYKTSLIVTCSCHQSSIEETVSTLKFATRAKRIKNYFKINIKNSPDVLQKIIYQLKKQLLEVKLQLKKQNKENTIIQQTNVEKIVPHQQIYEGCIKKYKKNPFFPQNTIPNQQQLEKLKDIMVVKQFQMQQKIINLQSQQNYVTRLKNKQEQINRLEIIVSEQKESLKNQTQVIRNVKNSYYQMEDQILRLKQQNQQIQQNYKQSQQKKDNNLAKLQALQKELEITKVYIEQRQNNKTNNSDKFIDKLPSNIIKNNTIMFSIINELKKYEKSYNNLGNKKLINLIQQLQKEINYKVYNQYVNFNLMDNLQKEKQNLKLLTTRQQQLLKNKIQKIELQKNKLQININLQNQPIITYKDELNIHQFLIKKIENSILQSTEITPSQQKKLFKILNKTNFFQNNQLIKKIESFLKQLDFFKQQNKNIRKKLDLLTIELQIQQGRTNYYNQYYLRCQQRMKNTIIPDYIIRQIQTQKQNKLPKTINMTKILKQQNINVNWKNKSPIFNRILKSKSKQKFKFKSTQKIKLNVSIKNDQKQNKLDFVEKQIHKSVFIQNKDQLFLNNKKNNKNQSKLEKYKSQIENHQINKKQQNFLGFRFFNYNN